MGSWPVGADGELNAWFPGYARAFLSCPGKLSALLLLFLRLNDRLFGAMPGLYHALIVCGAKQHAKTMFGAEIHWFL